MAQWSWIVSVHHASSPNVSKRNTSRPWFSSLADVSSIAWSLRTVALGPVLGADNAPAATAAPIIATMITREVVLHCTNDAVIQPPLHGYCIGRTDTVLIWDTIRQSRSRRAPARIASGRCLRHGTPVDEATPTAESAAAPRPRPNRAGPVRRAAAARRPAFPRRPRPPAGTRGAPYRAAPAPKYVARPRWPPSEAQACTHCTRPSRDRGRKRGCPW